LLFEGSRFLFLCVCPPLQCANLALFELAKLRVPALLRSVRSILGRLLPLLALRFNKALSELAG